MSRTITDTSGIDALLMQLKSPPPPVAKRTLHSGCYTVVEQYYGKPPEWRPIEARFNPLGHMPYGSIEVSYEYIQWAFGPAFCCGGVGPLPNRPPMHWPDVRCKIDPAGPAPRAPVQSLPASFLGVDMATGPNLSVVVSSPRPFLQEAFAKASLKIIQAEARRRYREAEAWRYSAFRPKPKAAETAAERSATEKPPFYSADFVTVDRKRVSVPVSRHLVDRDPDAHRRWVNAGDPTAPHPNLTSIDQMFHAGFGRL